MLPETSVSFQTEDDKLRRVYRAAEEKCRRNLKLFGGDPVLVEGGGYEKIWLETQPMGGEMYALRNLRAALNNCLLFMRHQREDGRLPGSIRCTGDKVEPQFDKYQGFCFPFPALNLYYLAGKSRDFLEQLKDTLVRFDACLWKTRHLNGNGLLSSFCVYDTGEDRALRYGDAPCWWEKDEPPEGYRVVPMASMDVTSWSFSARNTLAEICRIQGDPEEEKTWRKKAAAVAEALKKGLWDERRGALFDRDRNGNTVDILCHNTLRCMYWGSVSKRMADRFVQSHLLNPSEFWTPFPLPSVAADDPAFRNAPENNWSGQPEGLTYQRAILALERYGYDRIVTALGRKLVDTVFQNGCRFTQQYDPFTGQASLVHAATHLPVDGSSGEPVQDAYGPTMLACLEYIAHTYGIRPYLGNVWFSLGKGKPYEYTAVFYGHRYTVRSDGVTAGISADGKPLGRWDCGLRVITGETGNLLRTVKIEQPAAQRTPSEPSCSHT